MILNSKINQKGVDSHYRRINRNFFDYSKCVSYVILLNWIISSTGQPQAALMLLFIPLFIPKRIRIIKNKKMIDLYGLFLIYGLVITLLFWSGNFDHQLTINQEIKLFFIYGCCVLIYAHVNVQSYIKTMRNIGIVLSILAVIENIIKVPLFSPIVENVSNDGYRSILIFENSIMCGSFLGFFILSLVFIPLKNKKTHICVMMIEIVAVLMNASRSMWIGVILCLCIWGYKNNGEKVSALFKNIWNLTNSKVLLTFFLFFVFFYDLLIGNQRIGIFLNTLYIRIFNSFEAGEGKIIRIESIIKSLAYWKQNLFRAMIGSGKNYDKVFLSFNPIIKGNGVFVWDGCLDNQYLTWVHEFGMISILLIASMIFIAFKRIDRSKERYSIIINILFIYFMIVAFFYEMFNYPQMLIMTNSLFVMSDFKKFDERNSIRELKIFKTSRKEL